MTSDPRIDDFIANAAKPLRPVLEYLRAFVHRTVPGLDEDIKWNTPHFTYRGKNLAGINAFTAHAAIAIHGEGKGHGYIRIDGMDDLPDEADLAARLNAARRRIEDKGSAYPKNDGAPKKPEPDVPAELAEALAASPKAQQVFTDFAPSHRREYIFWVAEAKRRETRTRRAAQTVEWLAEGKKRNWKYEKG